MAVVGELELFEERLDPVTEGPLTTVMESSIHAILLLLWRVLEYFFKRCYCCFNLERIEVVEASKLTIAASEFAEDHGRILELITQVLDENVLKAGQVEAIFEGRNEEHMRL